MKKRSTAQEIVDEGPLHKYYTAIPNTVVRGLKSHGLSVYAKWLYVYLKSVTGDSGTCYRSTTTIAQESGISRGQVSSAKRELIQHGLIAIKKGKNPKRDADHVRIRDIWPANMQEFCVHITNSLHEEEEQENSKDIYSRVHNTNTKTSQQSSQYELRVHNTNTRVRNMNRRRSLEEDPLKKEEKPGNGSGRKKPQPTFSFPDDFIVSTEMTAWATMHAPSIDIATETAIFCDHWLSTGAEKRDWVATWRNWMRRQVKWEKEHGQRGRAATGVVATPRTTRDMTQAELAAFLSAPKEEESL